MDHEAAIDLGHLESIGSVIVHDDLVSRIGQILLGASISGACRHEWIRHYHLLVTLHLQEGLLLVWTLTKWTVALCSRMPFNLNVLKRRSLIILVIHTTRQMSRPDTGRLSAILPRFLNQFDYLAHSLGWRVAICLAQIDMVSQFLVVQLRGVSVDRALIVRY